MLESEISTWNPESTTWSPESKTVLDSLTWSEWSSSCLNVQINRVRLSATLFSVSLYVFFVRLVSVFNTIFSFGFFFFILTADPAGHKLGSIYILSLSPEFYFQWKRDFKSA